ncbi:MAG TPA: OmpA family protein [Blastocatellia bacterium]|nr:OmpA family protein [Blastocatellia bacterium]
MRTGLKISALALISFLIAGTALAQQGQQFGNIAERQRTSTVLGGTGMFNTFSTRTLYKGEFNFALFWNNFDRDPGAIDINQVPFNFTIGLTNRWEMWVDWVTWQQTTSRQPFLLSGYQYNAVRLFGDPFQILGPSSGGHGGAASFPGTGSSVGGILPVLGRFAIPVGGDGLTNLNSPAGPGGSPAVGLGPAIVLDRPNYFNDLPFFGEVDFLGFDGLGRPLLGPRQSSNGSGDVYVGTKFSLIDANKHWFSMALGGYLKIPISRDDDARARGRTSGEFEYGPILMFGQEGGDHRFRFYENIGYIHTGDVERGGVKVLDLRDKLLLSAGGAVSINKYVEFLAELAGTVYAGDSTRSFQRTNPLDLNLGARFFFRDGSIAFGGAYRRQLNGIGKRSFAVLECETITPPAPPDDCHKDKYGYGGYGGPPHCPPKPPPPPTIECKPKQVEFGGGDRNGFVGFFSIGRRNGCPPPPVPSCVLEAAPNVVTRGERLTLNINPTTPGYTDAEISYEYRWEVRDSQGRAVGVSGGGSSVEVPTARLSCGTYTATAIVTAKAKGSSHPECPDNTADSTCSASFEVTEPPCPNVSCNIVASSSTVTEGERIALRASGAGGDNLKFAWFATGGRLSSTTGREVTLNTTGVTGSVTVTVRVNTDRQRCGEPCLGSSCATTVTVREVPPPPRRPQIIRPCGPIFFPYNSARINNEHKACLDEIALNLQQDPRLTLAVDGHRDSSERVGISLTRANNARDYLVNDKGINSGRITVRNFGDTCPYENGDPKLNRRVEFWMIPDGASIADINAVKKCAGGVTPRIINNEQPAPSTEHGPARRVPRRGGRPEPSASLEEEETAPGASDERAANSGNGASQVSAYARPESGRAKDASSPGAATVVRSVSARMVDGALHVYVETDGTPEFKDFTLTNPWRIVVDISGVRSALGSKTLAGVAGFADRVRVGEPGSNVVRIVLDVKTSMRYRVVRDGATLVIIITESPIAAGPDN